MSTSVPTPVRGELLLYLVKDAEAGKTITVDGRNYRILGDEGKIRQIRDRMTTSEVSSRQFNAVLLGLGMQDFASAKANAQGENIIVRPRHALGARRVQDLAVEDSRIQNCVIEKFSNWNLSVPVYGALIPVENPLPTWADRKAETSYGNEMTCEAAEALIKGHGVLEAFKPFDYDSFPTICDFIGHAQEYLRSHLQQNAQNHPDLTEEEVFQRTVAEAFRTFVADSSAEAEKNRSGTCASVSREGKERLEKIGLRCQCVISKGMRSTDPPDHAAVVVPCNNGIIILELLPGELFVLKPRRPEGHPGEETGEPTTYESLPKPNEISLPPGYDGISRKGTIQAHFKIIETHVPYQIKNLVIVRELTLADQTGKVVQHKQTQYLLRSKLNPDHPVMENYILVESVYRKVEHTGGEKTRMTLWVEVTFDNGLIAVGKKEKGGDLQRIEIPVSIFNPETRTIDLSREPDETQREYLKQEILDFIGEGKDIETLGGFGRCSGRQSSSKTRFSCSLPRIA